MRNMAVHSAAGLQGAAREGSEPGRSSSLRGQTEVPAHTSGWLKPARVLASVVPPPERSGPFLVLSDPS